MSNSLRGVNAEIVAVIGSRIGGRLLQIQHRYNSNKGKSGANNVIAKKGDALSISTGSFRQTQCNEM